MFVCCGGAKVESSIAHSGRLGGLFLMSDRKKQNLSQLSKIAQDGCKVATEQVHSMLTQVLKDRLFNRPGCNTGDDGGNGGNGGASMVSD